MAMKEKTWPDRKNSLADKAALLVATGLGAGRLPWAPGTWGSLAAIPICLGFGVYSSFVELSFLFLLTALAIWTARRSAEIIGHDDPPEVVIDEVVGMAFALAFVHLDLYRIAAAFLFFRIFDIFKPFPIDYFDRNVSGGLGIVLDDVIAGIEVNVALNFIGYLLNHLGG
ncbi:MAG: phosphatidylglycerophosphatase A family protein [Dissulfurimicrobium sp.]